MPRSIRVIKIDPEKRIFATVALEGGNNLVRPIMRMLRAKQLGWFELCLVEEARLMGKRQKVDSFDFETYDAGPTPLIVAADAQAEDGLPGWRLRGGKASAGRAILFGKGVGEGMINCPVDEEWLRRQLVWLTPEECDADEVDATDGE